MVDGIKIEATTGDGRPVAELERLISERVRLIQGETTQNAVVATAINILKSVRAATRVADPRKIKVGKFVTERPDLFAGFYGDKGNRKGHRTVREAGGHHISSVPITNLMGGYTKGERPKVFIAISANLTKNVVSARESRRYIIARTKKEAEEFWSKFVYDRIKSYAGMARWAVGEAMRQVSAYGNVTDTLDPDVYHQEKAKRVAVNNLLVSCVGDGYSSGRYEVAVNDALNYAMAAIKGGSGEFDNILKRAANKTASIINFWTSKAWDGKTIEAPFPEVKSRK